jgi:hypothetical protein
MSERQEVEFKLRSATAIAPDAIEAALAAAGGDAAPPTFHTHIDLYLDDDRGSLLRQGLGLRLRRDGESSVLCCKERGQRRGAMHVRREIEEPWPRDAAPARARDLPELLGDAVEPFVLDRPLRPLVTLEVQREERPIRRGGVVLGDFAIDRVTALAQGRRASFFELELEVRGDVKACEQFSSPGSCSSAFPSSRSKTTSSHTRSPSWRSSRRCCCRRRRDRRASASSSPRACRTSSPTCARPRPPCASRAGRSRSTRCASACAACACWCARSAQPGRPRTTRSPSWR